MTGRIREAARLGNLTALQTLASELESEHGVASRGRSVRELARAFDFESLKRVADELEVSAAMGD